MSKLKLALGAAGLFLFIVGVKRSLRMESSEVAEPGADANPKGDGGDADSEPHRASVDDRAVD